jgi:hypothetical protein
MKHRISKTKEKMEKATSKGTKIYEAYLDATRWPNRSDYEDLMFKRSELADIFRKTGLISDGLLGQLELQLMLLTSHTIDNGEKFRFVKENGGYRVAFYSKYNGFYNDISTGY